MIKKKKFTRSKMSLIFLAVFPVIPSYFQLAGVALVNILCLGQIVTTTTIKNSRTVRLSFFKIILLLWMTWLLFVSILHSDIMSAVINILYIGACATVARTLDSEEKIVSAVDTMILVASIVGFFGIIESLTGFNVFSLINTSGMKLNYNPPRFGLTRIISSSGNAIEYCLYCMFMLYLTFYRYINLGKSKKKKKLLVIYCIIFINAILTLSRAALLCLFAGQILLLYFSGLKTFLNIIVKVSVVVLIMGVVLCFVFPPFATMIKQLVFMFLAILDDNYESMISSSFGIDNLSAFGNRLDLYEWVIHDMKDNLLLGMGGSTKFNHAFTQTSGIYAYTVIKESIEVDYLSTLWNAGIVGMLLKTFTCLALLLKSFKCKKMGCKSETMLSFSKMSFVCILCYLVAWLSVAQGTEVKAFMSIIAIFIAYTNLNRRKQK